MRTPGIRQDTVLVAARFPRDQFQELKEMARLNQRSIGKECVVLTLAALRKREMSKQEHTVDDRHSNQHTAVR